MPLLVTPSEEVRQEWRQLAMNSTYFMGQVIGHNDYSPDLHLRMAEWVQDPRPGIRKLGLVPRLHLKTSIWTIADTIRRITANPLERILIMNENATNAEDFLGRIKAVPERCQLWQWLFPERMPDMNDRWRSDSILFPRPQEFVEPTVTVIGLEGASTSKHFTHIKFDDLIGKEAATSPIVMQKAIDQYKLAEHLLVQSDVDQIHTYGTRWAPRDLYAWIQNNEDPTVLDRLWLGCYGVDEDGIPLRQPGAAIWPERIGLKELARIRSKNGEYLFALQMLNLPISDGTTEFSMDWLCYYTLVEENNEQVVILERPNGSRRRWKLSEMNVVMTVDPNTTQESRDARTAIVVLGIPPAMEHEPHDIILLEATAKKTSPADCIALAGQRRQIWQPSLCGIEVTMGQRFFFDWLVTEYPDGRWFKLKTDTHTSKLSRIRSASAYFQQRRVYVHRRQQDFLAEFEAFPQPYTVDLLDAFAYGPQVWSPPRVTDEEDDWQREEKRLQRYQPNGRNEVTGY